jgi:hypothetical protein
MAIYLNQLQDAEHQKIGKNKSNAHTKSIKQGRFHPPLRLKQPGARLQATTWQPCTLALAMVLDRSLYSQILSLANNECVYVCSDVVRK